MEEIEETVSRDAAAQERCGRRGGIWVLTCPDCGGVLWQVDEPRIDQFRRLSGHAHTGAALRMEQAKALERARWVVARSIEERTTLARQLAGWADAEADSGGPDRLKRLARAAERHLGLIRDVILRDALDPSARGAGGRSGGLRARAISGRGRNRCGIRGRPGAWRAKHSDRRRSSAGRRDASVRSSSGACETW
jgi:two-component system chemotaxis response regulator CheB